MTALSEALVAAQRQAISALSKGYVASPNPDPLPLIEALDAMGCTDRVEQGQLVSALDYLRATGAQAPEPTKPDTSDKPASEAQMKFAKKLADERGTTLPGYPLTSKQASDIISELKADKYVSDSWEVPF